MLRPTAADPPGGSPDARRRRRRREGGKREEAQRPEPARDRRPEGEQPHAVDAEMEKIAVDQRVGDERPDVGADAAGKRVIDEERRRVTRRNEGKQE